MAASPPIEPVRVPVPPPDQVTSTGSSLASRIVIPPDPSTKPVRASEPAVKVTRPLSPSASPAGVEPVVSRSLSSSVKGSVSPPVGAAPSLRVIVWLSESVSPSPSVTASVNDTVCATPLSRPFAAVKVQV
jgi:hypothetical protein